MLMGSIASCKVRFIGSIRIKIGDGIVLTMINIRHVLDMNKNLISLGTLDGNSCSCTLEKGTLIVTMDSQMVMKGKKVGSLYELIGSTIKSS